MCKKRKKDYRPFKDKFLDLYYNKPWKMILYTFLGSLALLIISILTGMKGGIICIFLYPVSLLFYWISLRCWTLSEWDNIKHPGHFVVVLWFSPFVCFIFSLLGVEL